LASGTRAETELEEMKEDFRRRTSDRFNEEMREMRQQARELDNTEQELSEQLSELTNPQERSTSLREETGREEIVEKLSGQKERLSDLVDRMRETVLDAEESEPLLADQLYETVRDAQQKELDNTLNTARRMLEYGFLDDARREEQQARSGIRELREGVERAAESVLGDETEALRRAQQVLEELSEQLDSEIARENPDGAQEREGSASQQPGQDREPREDGGQPQPGQSREGETPQEASESQAQQSQGNSGQTPGSESEQSPRKPADSSQQSPRPGQRPGEQPQEGQPGQQPGQPGEQGQPSDQSGQPSEQPGQSSPSDSEGQPQSSPGQQQQPGRSQQGSQSPGSPSSDQSQSGFERAFGGSQSDPNHVAPLGGDDFREWSDRLRDVEEMIDAPELRAEAARIRDRARGFRQDLKRHSKEPEWDLVELQVAKPLAELRDRIAEELLRRSGKDATLPLDRDPVPSKFTEQVRRYYERLGAGTE
jgi:hypothetical protein